MALNSKADCPRYKAIFIQACGARDRFLGLPDQVERIGMREWARMGRSSSSWHRLCPRRADTILGSSSSLNCLTNVLTVHDRSG